MSNHPLIVRTVDEAMDGDQRGPVLVSSLGEEHPMFANGPFAANSKASIDIPLPDTCGILGIGEPRYVIDSIPALMMLELIGRSMHQDLRALNVDYQMIPMLAPLYFGCALLGSSPVLLLIFDSKATAMLTKLTLGVPAWGLEIAEYRRLFGKT